MRVSIVVPTYKRPESLARCLDALQRQDRRPEEILVVARDDDKVSRDCVDRRGDQPVQLVSIHVDHGRPGFVAALNAGIKASTGEIVCLTDDDAEPHPDWISRILATFESSPSIGAVGGRDWVYHGDQLETGAEPVVGTVSRWGRVIGRHHLGVGPPRDVSVLKGVNLSVRGELIRQTGFDRRLRGVTTEHHSELGLCLRLLRMGYRIVYDPAIAVDHRPQPRVGENRTYGGLETRNASHNETVALLEHLSLHGRIGHLLWTTLIGTRSAPGIAQSLRLLLSAGDAHVALLQGNLTGRIIAIGTFLRVPVASKADLTPRKAASSARKARILAVAHSPNAAERARQLLAEVTESSVILPPPGIRGVVFTAQLVLRSQAHVLYLVDVGKTTTIGAVLGRLTGKRVILDTGDACYALARSLGDRSFAGMAAVGVGEQVAIRSAHEVVIRGRTHAAYIPARSTHIPDLMPPYAQPAPAADLRRELDLDGTFVVGVVGSLIFSPRLRISYGWDLVEALSHTASSVVAMIVGDGSGLEPLEARARELGVTDRCRFVGRVPTELVGRYVCATDVAISTQTNDLVGWVRTTGKLPLYLACGRPVLASHVGEAARLLGPWGWTVQYRGVVDRDYPIRLAAAVERWREDPGGAESRQSLALDIAKREFDLSTMRQRLLGLINQK